MLEDTFLHTTNVQYKKPKNKNKIHIESIEKEPIILPMTLWFNDPITDQDLRTVKQWLSQSSPQPLIFHDGETDRIYYAILDGESLIHHNYKAQGYITATMLTNSPYAYGHWQTVEGTSTATRSIQNVFCDSDIQSHCTLSIIAPSTGAKEISVTNLTTGESLSLTNLPSNVTVELDSEYEQIETSSDQWYGYDDHNGVFIHLASGQNEIEFIGDFTYKFTHQPILL